MTGPEGDARQHSSWLARIAAVIGPLLVFSVFGASTWTLDDTTEKSEEAVVLEEAIAAADPAVLFLGSSLVGRAVEEAAMGELLGAPVHVLWSSNAATPQWYAMLKNRAYATEARPQLVIVASTLRRMLLTQPRGDRQTTNLHLHLGEYEPLINRKTFGRSTSDSPWQLLRFRRSQLKDRILDGVKGLTMMGLSDTADSVDAGVAEVDPALERVFGGDNARDYRVEDRVIPVVDVRLELEAEEVGETVASEENYIPDLVELAQANGARVIFVNLPLNATGRGRETPPADEVRAALLQMQAAGAGYIDLSVAEDLGLGPEHFRDATHLNDAGQQIFTTALGLELLMADVLNPAAPLPKPVGVGVEARWSRTGEASGLSELVLKPDAELPCAGRIKLGALGPLSDSHTRKLMLPTPLQLLEDGEALTQTSRRTEVEAETCDGLVYHKGNQLFVNARTPGEHSYRVSTSDHPVVMLGETEVVWMPPGTELVLQLEGVPPQQAARADLVGIGIGDGDAAPEATLGGDSTPLRLAGNRWYLRQELSCPEQGCTLRIRSPADAPWIAFTDLDLVLGPQTLSLLGESFADAFENRLNLQGDKGLPPTYRGDPPPLPFEAVADERGKGIGHFDLPDMAWLSNKAIRTATLLNNASPLQVLEDGEELRIRGCRDVRKAQMAGTWCQAGAHVYFIPSDDTHPITGPHRYELKLRDDRVPKGRWLYPGDVLTFGLRPQRLVPIHEAPSRLQMSVWAFSPDVEQAKALTVVLKSGETAVLKGRVVPSRHEGGETSWAFEPGFASDEPLKATLRNPPDSGVFYLVRNTQIIEVLATPEELATGGEVAP